MYVIVALQNSSSFPGNPAPTIKISVGDDGWENAYHNWKSGLNPTDSVEWKKGVWAITKRMGSGRS